MEYLFLMPRSLQKARKALLSNCSPLFDISKSDTPNLVTMFFHTNFLMSTSQILAKALASAHFVKNQVPLTRTCNCLWPGEMGQEYLAPIVRMATGCWRDSDDLLADGSRRHAFGIAHIYAYTQQHPSASAATKIPELSLGVLMSTLLHDCHTPHHATRPEAHLLSRGASMKGTVPQKTSGIT